MRLLPFQTGTKFIQASGATLHFSFSSGSFSGTNSACLNSILDVLRKLTVTHESEDLTLSPISSEEEEVEQDQPSSAYPSLLKYFLFCFLDIFSPETSSPSSAFMMRQPTEVSRLPKMVLSSSSKKALSSIESWLTEKRDMGTAVFCTLPFCLSKRRCLTYVTGEVPSLGVTASSQGDFSSSVASSRRSSFSSSKILFMTSELEHLTKDIFRVFEILSFLDWTVGALAKKIEDYASLQDNFTTDWLSALMCR